MKIAIIGGSIAGKITAHALKEQGHQVTLFTRNLNPVPQSSQAHIFLNSGLRCANRIIPDLIPALKKNRVSIQDVGKLWKSYFQQGVIKRGDFGILVPACSRQRFENVLTQLVFDDQSIRVIEENVAKVLLSFDQPPSIQTQETQYDDFDWVIDASGTNSKNRDWLAQLNIQTTSSRIKVDLSYATATVKNAAIPEPFTGIICAPSAPTHNTAGLVIKLEDDDYIATMNLVGKAFDKNMTDKATFLKATQSLRAPEIHEALKDADFAEIKLYHKEYNTLHHFERSKRWPAGFLITGDAVCSQNPLYGQGMSCAFMAAEQIQSSIGNLNNPLKLQKRIQTIYAVPFANGAAEDSRWETTEYAPSSKLVNAITDKLMRGATNNATTAEALLRQVHMVDAPTAIFKPSVLWRWIGS